MKELVDDLYREIHAYNLNITEKEWLAFSAFLKPKVYKKGSCIFPNTEISKEIIFIVKGIVASEYLDQGDRIINRFFIPKNFATNLSSALTNQLDNDRVFAVTDVEAVVMPIKLFTATYMHSNGIGVYLRKKVLENLLEVKMFVSIKTMTGLEKKLDFLNDKYPEIILNVPWKYIADFLGVTPAWLSRTLKKRKG